MIIQIGQIEDSTYQQIRELFDEGIRSFDFIIDSCGGSLDSAFRIYDLLRSDETCIVSAKVDGMCASAATVLLLTAPSERRVATMHSTFLCHSPMLDYVGTINKQSAEELSNTINSAYEQLKNIYIIRTNSGNVIDAYMQSEKIFYADEALKLGFIGLIEKLYNTNTKMSRIKNLIQSILNQLKNETYLTVDGKQFEAMSLEVGVPVDNLPDGVYEIDPTGEVITVEQGVIVDVILPVAEPEPAVEDVKNEEQVEEPQTEEVKQEVVETVEQVAEEVTEAVSEEEIKQIVEEAIQELKVELENKYQPMCKLVNELGGLDRLKALKNSKSEAKNFKSEKPVQRSLEELMKSIRK